MRKKLESLLLDALDDYKTLNIVNINVQKLTTEMDSMIIATGTSTRHVKSASSSLVEYAKKQKFEIFGFGNFEFGGNFRKIGSLLFTTINNITY